jgi:hypothetical protein
MQSFREPALPAVRACSSMTGALDLSQGLVIGIRLNAVRPARPGQVFPEVILFCDGAGQLNPDGLD